MAVFSTNQVRQFYVLEGVGNDGNLENVGDGSICETLDNEIFLKYKGKGGITRSDLIKVGTLIDITKQDAEDARRPLNQAVVKLTANGGEPVPGQDYLLRISINPYIGMSDEEPYFKYGVVHAYAGMKNAEFFKVLAESLEKNFKRELTDMLTFEVVADEGENKKLVITEVPQEWTRGIKEQTAVNFTVSTDSIVVDGDEVTWGEVKHGVSDNKIGNGMKVADMEYFFMGERGDIYRNIGWPNSIPTEYMVKPDKEYTLFNIHYYFADGGMSPQKSEKDLTIAIDSTKTDVIDNIETTLNKYKLRVISGSGNLPQVGN